MKVNQSVKVRSCNVGVHNQLLSAVCSTVRHMCTGNSAPQDSRFYQHSCWSYM